MPEIPQDLAFFFSGNPSLLPLFLRLSDFVASLYPSASLLVQKSQVSFRDPKPFLYAWRPHHPRAGLGLGVAWGLRYA